MKHPVLTRAEEYPFTVEVGPSDNEGIWRIDLPKVGGKRTRTAFEGPCVVEFTKGELMLKDSNTRIYGPLNGAGPGTIKGRVSQCGLTWGGFFELRLET